jgi:Carboxypeptidase regulatory-like domain
MFSFKRISVCLFIVCVFSSFALAQEFRGSISGRVTEASGAAVPGATVTITNVATNTTTTAITNESGDYLVLFLNPGQYAVAVEAQGFKKTVRQGIEIRVGDRRALDLTLEVGAVADTVNITSDAPLLDANTASAGQVIDRRRISELPLSDGNPFMLANLAAGIANTGVLLYTRPFDNGGTSSILTNGAAGGNEFTLDGSPNQANGRRVAFVPPADAVQEFKVETASFDAQQSHTAGATVNVTIRSGTNNLHGTAYEFVRNDILSANNFFSNRSSTERDVTRYNRFGGTIGGPVHLPKKIFGPLGYDGRNRSFFFFAYEGLKDVFPDPQFFTVPTRAMREGDFSALPPDNVIYDPATARRNGNRVERSPFPENNIPQERFSRIARNYLQYYPLPNVDVSDPAGTDNYFSKMARSDDFNSQTVRFDQNISDKQKFFVRYTHNFRREDQENWTGEINGINPTGRYSFRTNNGATFDHVYNFSPTAILNTRVGYSRFVEKNEHQSQGKFDPASLGFSEQALALFGDASHFPQFEIDGLDELGGPLGNETNFNIYSVQPTLTKIAGAHSFRLGYDFRAYRENGIHETDAAGRYSFNNNFTRRFSNTNDDDDDGQPFASFLLGLPTGGEIDHNASRSNQTLYQGIFVHDDWKATRRLTLNLGLRYELEGATTERFNRNLRGFDPTLSSPIEAAAKAAFAANPPPGVPASSFNVKGGLLFADEENRSFWGADKNNVQPRIGLAFRLNDKTVLRGGWGVYTVPFIIFAINQSGFSQPTTILPSNNNGLTFQADLFNPFPFGVTDPPGASQGSATSLGRGLSNLVPRELNNSQAQRWEFSLQRELPGNWLVEASYVGNRGYNLTTGNISNLANPIPPQYLSTSRVFDQGMDDVRRFLTDDVDNPFRGLLPGTGFNNPMIDRSQLLRPFPQFGDIASIRNDGENIFHSGQFRAEKRFSKGYSLLAAYTWSKNIEEITLLNFTDANLERRIAQQDIPHRVVVSGIWELPFGKGRKWGSGWSRYLDGLLGGWQLNGIFQWQSGRPLEMGNIVYNGDPSRLRTEINSENADITRTVFDTSGFYFNDAAVQTNGVVDPVRQRSDRRIRLENNIRYFPSMLPGFRGQNLHLWDLSVMKKVRIKEGVHFELRGEFLNAFNHVQFGNPNTNPANPNFGRLLEQDNLPRSVQIGLKLVF